jgi:hypothetical protein
MLPNEEEKERKNRKHGIYYQFVVDTTSRGILEYLKNEGSQSFLSNEKKNCRTNSIHFYHERINYA